MSKISKKLKVIVAGLILVGVVSVMIVCEPTKEAYGQATTVTWVNIWTLFDSSLVNETNAIISSHVEIKRYGYFSLHYRAWSSSGAPEVDVKYYINSATNTAVSPVVPRADSWVAVSDSLVVDDLAVETWDLKSISPPCTRWLRIVVKGEAANPADTRVWVYLATGS